MRFEGSLKSWNDERGFGFIQPDQGGEEIFVHIKSMANLRGRPALSQRLSFEVELGPQGKKRAKNVLPVREPTPIRRQRRQTPAQWGTATLFALPAFLILYAVIAFVWRPPLYVGIAYVAMSAVTFLAYAADKSAASRGARRTPESTLHAMALACGWPGALVAQQALRHKSSKAEFRSVFWVTVILNVVAFVALCSPVGRHLLPR
jgi:uncharacterized membrane protein YsdA (DUF1294 family)/cold shock CspA family protein